MRQLIKIILTILFTLFLIIPSNAALKGNLEYHIPIDYSNINTSEVESLAENAYNKGLKNTSGKLDENITEALNLYTILSNKHPENINYALKVGSLYDLIKKDRYAKSNYYRAMGINPSRPEAYFYFGEFYYKRQMYKKAIKMYKEAYSKGYNNHYTTLYRLGDICQKFGDTQEAQIYLQSAANIQSDIELNKKIETINTIDCTNKEYYKR